MIGNLLELEDALQAVLEAVTITDGTSAQAGLKVNDRPDETVHLGVDLEFPDSVNAEKYSDRTEAWSEDVVRLRFHYQIRGSFRASRQAAHRIEDLIRVAVTGDHQLSALHPRWIRSTRRKLPPDNDWYEIVQVLGFHHDAALGGG